MAAINLWLHQQDLIAVTPLPLMAPAAAWRVPLYRSCALSFWIRSRRYWANQSSALR